MKLARMVRRWCGTLLVLLALVACGKAREKPKDRPPARTVRALAGDVAITGATLVPMDREGTLTGHTILIRGDRIVALAPAATVDTSAATVVDAPGQWVLPGLADMHVHVMAPSDLALFTLNGVTTVRDMFGAPDHLRWRDAIARGEQAGPTMIVAGPIMDGEPPMWPTSAVVTTAAAARAEVVAQKQAGYDWIKVYGGLGREAYDAILDEAKRQGLPVAGHVPKAVGVDGVLAAGGQRSIEHLDGYVPFRGDPPPQPLVEPTVKAGVWNCPTLVVADRFGKLDDPAQLAGTRGLELMSPAIRSSWDPKHDFRLKAWTPERYTAVRQKNELRRALVGELHEAGAKLVLGTDTGNPFVVPGFAVVDELKLLVAAGLTPWHALRTATAAASELQGTPGEFGVIAVGARADLIILDRDPLAEVGNAVDPARVVLRGKLHARTELLDAAQPVVPPADLFAALPALEPEGTELAAARYQVLMNGQPIGGERAALSRSAGGALIVHGQVVYTTPRAMQATYRSTRDLLDLTTDALTPAHVVVTREGANVIATQDGQPPITLAVEGGAVIAPQSIAEFVWYAGALGALPVGKAMTLTAAEIVTEGKLTVDPGRFTFTRAADADGRRVYAIGGTHGRLDVTGQLVVAADGLPHETTVTVKYGTFVTRRVP